MAKAILDELDLQVDVAEDGNKAVQYVANKRYDAILMDLQMPIMDGYEATKQIRERDAETPIIAMTADAMKGLKEQVLGAGHPDLEIEGSEGNRRLFCNRKCSGMTFGNNSRTKE